MPADSRQSLSLRRIQHLSFAPVSPVKPRLQRQNLKASEAYVSALAKAPTPRDGWTSIALSASSSASCSSTHHPPGGRQAHAPSLRHWRPEGLLNGARLKTEHLKKALQETHEGPPGLPPALAQRPGHRKLPLLRVHQLASPSHHTRDPQPTATLP